jgi:hypothetical protein
MEVLFGFSATYYRRLFLYHSYFTILLSLLPLLDSVRPCAIPLCESYTTELIIFFMVAAAFSFDFCHIMVI